MLSSGMSSAATTKPQNIMMDAIVIAKKQEDQKHQLENRIIKLKKQEEEANKRIKELQRKQQFVHGMNEEKAWRFGVKADMMRQRQDTEENNRKKFTQDRLHSQNRIHQNMERTFQSNRGAYNDIKNQQQQINDIVTQNSVFDLKSK